MAANSNSFGSNLRQELRKYGYISFISIKSNLAYLSEIFSRVIFLALILFIFLQLWRITYGPSEKLAGFTLAQMIWYLAFTEANELAAPRVSLDIDQDVRTGMLGLSLIKPLPYPLYRLFTSFGERFIRFLFNFFIASILIFLMIGPINLNILSLFIFIALPLTFILDFLFNFLIGLGAFWLEDTSGITLIYRRLTLILGGVLIPIGLLPDFLQNLIGFLPFSAMAYDPAKIFVAPDWLLIIDVIAKQLIWIAIASIAVVFVYKIALSKVQSHGG